MFQLMTAEHGCGTVDAAIRLVLCIVGLVAIIRWIPEVDVETEIHNNDHGLWF